MAEYDLAIVGGGINGAGIARDAAGRGLRVLLVEQSDLASGTSSASTKLIHGGLRYLEHYWFGLVRKALSEREILWRAAPHLIRPMRFVLPHEPGMRPAWTLRLGLFIYDHLGGRKLLPGTRRLDLERDPVGAVLQANYRYGFEYSDCQVDDARLVVVNAVDAAERGATVRTRTRCVGAHRDGEWRLDLDAGGVTWSATARVLVNATGPWAAIVGQSIPSMASSAHVHLDKGSHIVVRRLFDHDRAYIFQTADGRVVFAIPFERDFTLVGTTDAHFAGDPADVQPSAEEIDYLCAVVSGRFRTRISPADVLWSFAGVRALYGGATAKPQDTPRDYVLALDETPGQAPLLTIHGGKITTYRILAEAALAHLAHVLGARPAWTKDAPLPGGDFPLDGVARLVAETQRAWPFLKDDHARRLVRAYGTRIARVLGSAKSMGDLGPLLGADLSAGEVRYLIAHEWAQTAEDVLWRRSKLGLRFSPDERGRLARFMQNAIGGPT